MWAIIRIAINIYRAPLKSSIQMEIMVQEILTVSRMKSSKVGLRKEKNGFF